MTGAPTITYSASSRRDWLVTACAPILWGTMPAVATEALAPGHALLIATVRSIGAGLVFALLAPRLPPRAWHSRILALGTINIALTFALFFVSASRLPGGIISILMAFSPFWAVLFSWPLLNQRPQPIQLLLILLGVAGVSLLVGASNAALDVPGIVAGVAASGCMGCGIVLVKKWGRPAPIFAFTSWQLMVGGVLLTALMLWGEGLPDSLTWTGAGALSYLALACTALAYALWFRGIETIGPQRTAMLLLLVPLVALAIDVLLFGKRLTWLQSVGALLILVCLYFDGRRSLRQASSTRSHQTHKRDN